MENIYQELYDAAKNVRRGIMTMANQSDFHSHYGSSLSMVEIVTVLYKHVMHHDPSNPQCESRDRFFLSKGHCVLGLYAVLHECGYISDEELLTYQTDFSDFNSHGVINLSHGIETSSGSLGHGLGLAIGSLVAGRIRGIDYRAFVVMGNGECNEGSVWEAAMLASQCKLDNLVAVIDYNRDQGDGSSEGIINMDPMAQKWEAFGWNVKEVDGHSIEQLVEAFDSVEHNGKPTMIIANTIKGKGVSFMEGQHEWHHNKATAEQFEQAMNEIENS